MAGKSFCLKTDAPIECKRAFGEFSYDRENGLSFTCHSIEHDYDLTKLALLELKAHIEQQLRDEPKCPFFHKQQQESAA